MAETETLSPRQIVDDAFSGTIDSSMDADPKTATDALDDADEGVSGVEGLTDRDEPQTGEEPANGKDRGDGRDATGKFVPKPTTETDPKTEQAAPAAEEAPKPVTTAAPVADAAATKEPEGQPWRVKVGGTEYETGATFVPGKGLSIPEPAMQAFQTAVQEGVYYKANWQRLEREAIDKGKTEGKALGDKILDQIAGFAEKVASGDAEQQMSVLRWFMDYNQNLPRLQAELERDQLKAQLESRTQTEKAQAEEATTAQLATQKDAYLARELTTMLADPAYAVLTKDDKAAIETKAKQFAGAMWVQQSGEWYLDTDKLALIVKDRAEIRAEAAKQTKALAEAAKHNAAATRTTPPATAAARSKAASPAKGEAEMSPAEWKAHFKDKWRKTPGLPTEDDDDF